MISSGRLVEKAISRTGPFRLLSAMKMVTRLTLSGRWEAASAYIRGLRDGWRDSV